MGEEAPPAFQLYPKDFLSDDIVAAMDNEELVEVHPLFEQIARRENFFSEALMTKIDR